MPSCRRQRRGICRVLQSTAKRSILDAQRPDCCVLFTSATVRSRLLPSLFKHEATARSPTWPMPHTASTLVNFERRTQLRFMCSMSPSRLARRARGCNIPCHEEADLDHPPGDRRAHVCRVRLCPVAQQPSVRSRPQGLRPARCELRALHVGERLAAWPRSPVESQPELAPSPSSAALARPATASLESSPSAAAQSAPTERHAATRPCQLPAAAAFRAGQVSRDRDVNGRSIARRSGVTASSAPNR